jgi:hypothetical protein
MFGPKSGGSWPSGVSLVGAQGSAGPAGPAGAAGSAGTIGATGPAGPQGPTGLLTSGSTAGNTPYWNGSSWVINSSNIFNNGGNVGIGTTTPSEKLEVSGNLRTSGTIRSGTITYPNTSGTNGQFLTTNGSGTASWATVPSGGISSLGTIAGASTANGASITSGVLNLAPADGSNGGVVTTGTQTFAGSKTFSSDLVVNQISIGKGKENNIQNTVMGYTALANTTGEGNTAFGFQGQWKGTSGSGNSTLGFAALIENTTGSRNTALGYQAAQKNIGSDNISIGFNSMYLTTNSSNNIVIGTSSFDLSTVNGSNNNIVVGKESLRNATPASQNMVLGHSSGAAITTETNNTLLGFQTNSTAGVSNATAIGKGAIAGASNSVQLGDINVTNVKTSGTLTAGTVTYPNTHGTNGQVLTTSGSGTLTWTTASASSALVREVANEFTATVGQTAFTVTQTPSVNSRVKMYINGIRISNTAYSISGTTVTYVPANNGNNALSSGDRIQFDYYY